MLMTEGTALVGLGEADGRAEALRRQAAGLSNGGKRLADRARGLAVNGGLRRQQAGRADARRLLAVNKVRAREARAEPVASV